MKKLLLSLLLLFLAACARHLDGVYSDQLGATTWTFRPNGKLYQATLGIEVEARYEMEGEKVIVYTADNKLILTLDQNGILHGPLGLKLSKQ